MNIGFIGTRFAGVDGVSLETTKLAHIFREMGHECFFCAGELDEHAQPGTLVPGMHFTHPETKALHDEAFTDPVPSPALFQRIYAQAARLREATENFIATNKLDLLVPQNALCIPMNLALGVGITEAIERTRIKTLAHHHDFYWERERFINNGVQDVLSAAFPPNLAPMVHMVINTPMQQRLRAFRGIEALHLPNVMDYDNPPPPPDAYAASFREAIGLNDDDLIVLQPTRIVRRKGIEKAIELVRKLDDPRLVLVVSGYEGDEPGGYGAWLREEADRAGIRYVFAGDYVDTARTERNGHRVYTLQDVYPDAHIVTYPSIYEGFGNALLETIYFHKPLVVHRYPMYLSDIKPAGVRAVEFWHDIDDDVLTQTRRLIDAAAARDMMTSHNYQIGREHFSYDRLRTVLKEALHRL